MREMKWEKWEKWDNEIRENEMRKRKIKNY